jgi:hypothetical protein
VPYLDISPDQLRAEYWAWWRLLDNAANLRAGRCLRRVELIEAVARKRRIRLTPAREGR